MKEHENIALQSCSRYCGTCLKLLREFTRRSSASKMRRLSSCTFLLVFPHLRYILRGYLLKRTTVCSLLYGKSYPSFTSTVRFVISILFFLPAYHLPVFSFHQISCRLLFEKSTLRIGFHYTFHLYHYTSILNLFYLFLFLTLFYFRDQYCVLLHFSEQYCVLLPILSFIRLSKNRNFHLNLRTYNLLKFNFQMFSFLRCLNFKTSIIFYNFFNTCLFHFFFTEYLDFMFLGLNF